MSDYFTFSTPLSRQTLARAEALNAIFRQIETGLDKLPPAAELATNSVMFGADTGILNAYQIVTSRPVSPYPAGMTVALLAATTNTGPATLGVNGLGDRAIRTYLNNSLTAGDIQADTINLMVYDGTVFRLVGPTIRQIQALDTRITNLGG
jgi:hypothetical protein